MAVTLAANPSQAQKLIKKELQTENNEKDGFQYQWNRYTYLQGKDTLDAAFDLNNKRITPNGYRKYEKGKGIPGVRYVGGGRFSGSRNIGQCCIVIRNEKIWNEAPKQEKKYRNFKKYL